MTNAVLSSTFLLTLLLMVGLFFFIRASTKDRTEILRFTLNRKPSELKGELESYFCRRAYHLVNTDVESQKVTLSGTVRPSVFLVLFLSTLAAVGAFCFILVLATLFPGYGYIFSPLLLISPGAGWFYWKKARREETVTFEVDSGHENNLTPNSEVIVTAHRDELAILRKHFLSAS